MQRSKNQSQTFQNRKVSLPPLSMQDMRVIFANSSGTRPATKVIMAIPYYHDIMSAQGVKEWNTIRASTIEQEDIVTIKNDTLTQPGAFQFTVQPVNHFEPIDTKVREIEKYADIMEQDLDELEIPQVTETPYVEPIFTEYPKRAPRVRFDEDFGQDSSSSKPKQFGSSKPKTNKYAISSTERAREKVKIAERTLRHGFGDSKKRKKVKSSVKKNVSNDERGKLNWARINELMQDDKF